MTVVIGTAGHIDHGKTALVRALTGIDADRLPEERARGMTINVGYAHLALPDGEIVDIVDVPGHDRLVGNMLVGAGEIDCALLVVAADDGPRAQTVEHLLLLDALGIAEGVVALTKADLVGPDDPRRIAHAAAIANLLTGTTLAGAEVVAVSATTGAGLDALRAALVAMSGRVAPGVAARHGPARLAIDRAFSIRGHGTVVTGSLRGGALARGASIRIEPGGRRARIREIQVHNGTVDRSDGGRTALNLSGVEVPDLHRGMVVIDGQGDAVPDGVDGPEPTDRMLVAVGGPVPPGRTMRLHVATAEAEARIGRGARERTTLADGRTTTLLRLDRPVAIMAGDRFALRTTAGEPPIGGIVVDPTPPRGPSRRRVTPDRLAASVASLDAGAPPAEAIAARLDLHGALVRRGGVALTADVREALDDAASDAIGTHHAADPASAGLSIEDLRTALRRTLRRLVTLDRQSIATAVDERIGALVSDGRLARDRDRIRDPGRAVGLPDPTLAAMDRLESMLAVNDPPPLAEAARLAGCPADGVRALESSRRIVRLEPDLAYASSTFAELTSLAVSMASTGPLSPAALRDATGTSRRYVMAILEELGRRGVLTRTAAGHVPGPRASVA